MKIPITITVHLKLNGELYSEAKRMFVLKDGAAPKVDIRAIAENLKNDIKQFSGAETVEFITQEEYAENVD